MGQVPCIIKFILDHMLARPGGAQPFYAGSESRGLAAYDGRGPGF